MEYGILHTRVDKVIMGAFGRALMCRAVDGERILGRETWLR